ncbi:MAG TPA: cytochrome c-type biogenesis protein CcmH [Gaiellaceae bacterium]|nr:cytochrome c-type biogenesis protein CcmH [Gaiellaceae bacterium]
MRLLAPAAAALALALAAPALASEQHPTQGEIEAELVCPQCHTPLDESDSPIAQQMKAFIRAHIAMGWTKSRIENALAAEPGLGKAIFGVPRRHGFDLLAWLLPLGGIALGAVALAGGAWAWSRNRPGAAPPADGGPVLDPALERRVDEELARFEA